MKITRRNKRFDYNPNNLVKLVRGGKEYFDTLEKLIAEAKEVIHFQTYIFDDDETATRIRNHLVHAAERGVKVMLLLDGYASSLPPEFRKPMNDAGIGIRYFSPLFRSRNFYFGRRLHHKVVAVDQLQAVIGGMNISNRYNDMRGTPAWFDLGVYVKGQAAVTLHAVCNRLWEGKLSGHWLPNLEKKIFFSEKDYRQLAAVRVRTNDWLRGKADISRSYTQMIVHAKDSLTIISSYFLPGNLFMLRLIAAAKRGVKIRIILAGISDIKLSKYASRYLYDIMLRHGIDIFEYKRTVLHAKAATCDSEWATVGSFNINNLSAYASIELNLDIRDKPFVKSLDDLLEEMLVSDCEKISLEQVVRNKKFFQRIKEWSAYTLSRFLLFLFTFNIRPEKEKGKP